MPTRQVVNLIQGGNFVDLVLNGSSNAECLKETLEGAGFMGVRMKQPSGLSKTDMWKLTVPNKPGGSTNDTIDFLKEQEDIEMP